MRAMLDRIEALEASGGGGPGGGAVSWGSITGALSSQSDLAAELGTKASVASLTAGLAGKLDASALTWAGVAGKPSTFAPDAHTHTIANVTGLQTALDGKQAAGSYAAASHVHTIANVTGLQTALDGKQASLPGGGTSSTFLRGDLTWATPPGGGSDPWSWIKLASNVANSTVTLANATGLSFTAAANTTYLVEVFGAFQSAATTTGIALALDIPSGSVIGMVEHMTSATALIGVEQIADAATTGVSTGVRAATTNTPIKARFLVAIGATGGTVQLQFRSEVAASAVTLIGGLFVMGYRALG